MLSDAELRGVFSRNLSDLINASGKSQKEVADAIQVSPQTLNTWVRGIAMPRMGKIELLASYFGVEKSALLERHNEDEYSKLKPTESELEMLRKYRFIDDSARHRIDTMLNMEYNDALKGVN